MTMNPYSNIINQKVVGESLHDQLIECYDDNENIVKIVIEVEDKDPNGLSLDTLLPENDLLTRFKITAAESFQRRPAMTLAKESLSRLGIYAIELDTLLDNFSRRLAASRKKLMHKEINLCLTADVSLSQAIQIIELDEIRTIELFPNVAA